LGEQARSHLEPVERVKDITPSGPIPKTHGMDPPSARKDFFAFLGLLTHIRRSHAEFRAAKRRQAAFPKMVGFPNTGLRKNSARNPAEWSVKKKSAPQGSPEMGKAEMELRIFLAECSRVQLFFH